MTENHTLENENTLQAVPGYAAAAPSSIQPAQYPWATGKMVWAPAQTEPLQYHRLLRGMRRYEWWKPLIMAISGTALYFAISILLGVAAGIFLLFSFGDSLRDQATMQLLSDPQALNEMMESGETQPLVLLFLLLSVALMLPAALVAMRFFGKGVPKRVWSVALKIRWDLFWRAVAAALAVCLVVQGASVAITLVADPAAVAAAGAANSTDLLLSVVVVLLLVPLQATAEEVVFRGVLLQMIGSWLKSPVLAVIVTSVLFGAMHVQYNLWGISAVTIMGVAAAIVTLRTGGLEAAMALHIVNNIFAFGLGLFGAADDSENMGPLTVLVELVLLGLFVAAVELIWRSSNRGDAKWQTTRIDTVERPRPAAEVYAQMQQQYIAGSPTAAYYAPPVNAPVPAATAEPVPVVAEKSGSEGAQLEQNSSPS